MNLSFEKVFLLFIFTIFFFPKLDVVTLNNLPSVKPEDIAAIPVIALLVKRMKFLSKSLLLSPFVVLPFVSLFFSFFYFPTVALFFRLLVSFGPIYFTRSQSRSFVPKILNIIICGVLFTSVLMIAQKFFPIPFVHTGQFHLGPAERPPGFSSNAVEASLLLYFACILLVLTSGCRSYKFTVLLLAVSMFAIAMSETRIVFLAQILLLIGFILKNLGVATSGVAARFLASTLIMLFLPFFFAGGRLEGVFSIFATIDFDFLISFFEPGRYLSTVDNYCFKFNDDLAQDQSLAMRFSKFIFVFNHVVLGENWFGFGLGRCIGGAADNQLIRFLNDFGLIGFVVAFSLLSFYLGRFSQNSAGLVFFGISAGFLLCFFFYDIFYFSRSLPMLGLIALVFYSPVGLQSCRKL